MPTPGDEGSLASGVAADNSRATAPGEFLDSPHCLISEIERQKASGTEA